MYETVYHGVSLARGGADRFVQLQHKSIGVGPRGGTAGTYFPLMMNTLGVPISTVRFGEGADLDWQVEEGMLDAFLFASGVPTPHFTKLAARRDITFIGFSQPELDWLSSVYPETYKSCIPANKYTSQEVKLDVLGTFNFAVGIRSLSNDYVYNAVKMVLGQPDRLRENIQKQNPDLAGLAAQTRAANWRKNTFLPFHPGAARYLREVGEPIPDDLIRA